MLMGQCCFYKIFWYRIRHLVFGVFKRTFAQCNRLFVLAYEKCTIAAHLQVQPATQPLPHGKVMLKKVEHEFVKLLARQHVTSGAPVQVQAGI